MDVDRVSLQDQIKEVKREIQTRQHFYGLWIERGTLSPEVAAKRMATMQAVLRTLEAVWEQTRRAEELPLFDPPDAGGESKEKTSTLRPRGL